MQQIQKKAVRVMGSNLYVYMAQSNVLYIMSGND